MNRRLVIKEDRLFLVAGPGGSVTGGEQGLYLGDTRHLSRLELLVNATAPEVLAADLTSPYRAMVYGAGPRLDPASSDLGLAVARELALGHTYRETTTCTNHYPTPVTVEVRYVLDCDFADMLEVRGISPPGRLRTVTRTGSEQLFSWTYDGADGIFRHTRARLSPAPTSIEGDGSRCVLVVRRRLKSGESLALTLDVTPGEGELGPFPEANLEAVAESHRRWISDAPRIAAGPADAIVRRAQEDLRALLFPTEDGLYPAAGIPWYVVPFGRDALIIAFQSLPFYPQVAQGVLRHLARHQAKEYDPWRDAAPGKILHELRTGETTRLGLTPHAPYYGSIDATPLFIALLAEYYRWTGDLALIQELESNLQAALGWAAGPGDPDGDGLLEYRRESSRGLDNQGWKDASDSMSHASGQLLAAPIALVEAQGYLYDAYTGAALLYRALGDTRTAQQLESKAQTLRQRFWQHFWSEELGLYALALDYAKQPALVASSNPGHCLWSGMASTQHARRMAERLFAPDLWSGWGIRTLSANAPRYNPMSYHNGSVWPHDNALIAWGLKRYGCDQAANSIVSTLLQAAQTTPDLRLPELFCGFTRLAGTPPVPYPAACVPQGWDAGAVLLFLRTLLGLEVDAAQRLITLRPALPPQLPQLTIEGLPLGSASVTISAWRAGEETRFEVTGDVAVQLARPLV